MQCDDWLYLTKGVHARLKNCPQLTLFKVFVLLPSGIDFLLEGDGGVFIDSIDFVGVRAEVGEFLAADLEDVEEGFVGFLDL